MVGIKCLHLSISFWPAVEQCEKTTSHWSQRQSTVEVYKKEEMSVESREILYHCKEKKTF